MDQTQTKRKQRSFTTLIQTKGTPFPTNSKAKQRAVYQEEVGWLGLAPLACPVLVLVNLNPFFGCTFLAGLVTGAESAFAAHFLVPFRSYLFIPRLSFPAAPLQKKPHKITKFLRKHENIRLSIKGFLDYLINYLQPGVLELRGSCSRFRQGRRSLLPLPCDRAPLFAVGNL